MSTRRPIPEDTRQALILERDNSDWLDDRDEDTDNADEYHSDPLSILERKERDTGCNARGRPITTK